MLNRVSEHFSEILTVSFWGWALQGSKQEGCVVSWDVFPHITQFSGAVHSLCALTARPNSGLCECVSVRELEWACSDFCNSSIGQVTSKAAKAQFLYYC